MYNVEIVIKRFKNPPLSRNKMNVANWVIFIILTVVIGRLAQSENTAIRRVLLLSLVIVYTASLSLQWWLDLAPNLYEIHGMKREMPCEVITSFYKSKEQEMFGNNEYADDERAELKKDFEILTSASTRLEYEKNGYVEEKNKMNYLIAMNTFYAGWLLVGVAITSSSRLEQARSHILAMLALIGTFEFWIHQELTIDMVITSGDIAVFDWVNLMHLLFQIPILCILYAFDMQNEEEVKEDLYQKELLDKQNRINTTINRIFTQEQLEGTNISRLISN